MPTPRLAAETKTLQAVVPAELAVQVVGEAVASGESVSELIRQALLSELERRDRLRAAKDDRRVARPDPTRVIRHDGKDVSPGKRQVNPIQKTGKR